MPQTVLAPPCNLPLVFGRSLICRGNRKNYGKYSVEIGVDGSMGRFVNLVRNQGKPEDRVQGF